MRNKSESKMSDSGFIVEIGSPLISFDGPVSEELRVRATMSGIPRNPTLLC
jgi:hypothetical protein